MVGEILVAVAVWIADKILPWSMLVSLALWWGKSKVVFRPSRLLWLFLLGLMEDISMVDYLGLTSGWVISLMMVTWLVSRYYQTKQLWWWYILGIVGEVGIGMIHQTGFSFGGMVLQLGGLAAVNWWSVRFGKQDAIYIKV